MKIVAISDTHGQHAQLKLPSGDILIHAGDISQKGKATEIIQFLKWFEKQPFEIKIFIAGNHDFCMEDEHPIYIKSLIPSNVTYLNDSGVRVQGIHIWGSPITPFFYNFAFNRHRGAAIKRHWDMIPLDADVVVTHGPAYQLLDYTDRKIYAGCADLSARLAIVKPRLHICGHIHEGYGQTQFDDTHYLNASVLDSNYELVNAPVEFEW